MIRRQDTKWLYAGTWMGKLTSDKDGVYADKVYESNSTFRA